MAGKLAKKGSGNITISRQIGYSKVGMSPPPKGNGPRGGANITVDRTVKSPPTRKPAK